MLQREGDSRTLARLSVEADRTCAIMSLRARGCVTFPVCSCANYSLKQFAEMQKMMKQMGALAKGGRLPKIPGMPRLG